MNKTTTAFLERAGIAGLLGATLCGAAGTANAATVTYSGRATALSATATVVVLQPKVVIGDTGELEPSGSVRNATSVSVEVPGPVQVGVGTINANTSGSGNVSGSSVQLQKVRVNVAGLLQIYADAVDADSSARCNFGLPGISTVASSAVGRLSINGILINTTIQPGITLTIPIPGVGAVTLNEQVRTGRSITVNAIHVTASAAGLAGADVVIGHAESGIGVCPP